MIRRQYPSGGGFKQSPLLTYSLLLLGQGFTREEFEKVRAEAWYGISRKTKAFGPVLAPGVRNYAMAVFHTMVDLTIEQNDGRLTIPSAESGGLSNFLANESFESYPDIKPSVVWPPVPRTGRCGCLVAVLVKGDTPGELYELDESDAYPTPLVAVVARGQHWLNVILRAIGQTFAGLVDEFVLPNQDKMPVGMFGSMPNLIAITDEERNRLVSAQLSRPVGEKPRDIFPCFPGAWDSGPRTTETWFYPFDDQDSKAKGGIQLVEGGAGYKRNVLRGDFDCLMKRKPNADRPADAIQSDIQFCQVCQNAIKVALEGSDSFDMARAKRISLRSQKLSYDLVNWGDTIKGRKLPLVEQFRGPTGSPVPQWSCEVEASTAVGLKITDLQLHRPLDLDPLANAKDIVKSIQFKNLAVKFKGNADEEELPFEKAFADETEPLKIAGPAGGGDIFQTGIKLSLKWDLPGKALIEVALSLVLRGQKADFDPGGGVVACKFYPQISMRHLRAPKGTASGTGKRPVVEYLRGSVVIECVNVVPTDLAQGLDEDLKPMATGRQIASLFTDSNSTFQESAESDNEYTFNRANIAGWGAGNAAPYFGLWTGEWKKGRKIAGVVSPSVQWSSVEIAPGTAFFGFKKKAGPPLPHWSCLFDYADPQLREPRTIVGAYANWEKTPDPHNADVNTIRDFQMPWPKKPDVDAIEYDDANPFTMKIVKLPRQGFYDNVHIHADMGKHDPAGHEGHTHGGETSQAVDLVAAPFCADLCLHLHWRWGVGAVQASPMIHQLLGWGDGEGDRGARTTRGTPLIPPNQHVDVTIEPADQKQTTITYDVRAYEPRQDEAQVFLEQGLALAFRYSVGDLCGISIKDFVNLLGLVAVLTAGPIHDQLAAEEKKLNALVNNPAKRKEFDLLVRRRFHEIYRKIRFYDPAVDKTKQNVQQVPSAPRGLEQL